MMKPGWWRAVEALADGAVMADWALELGNEFEAAQPLLQPTAAQAETYPCTNRFRCECRHRVEPDGRGGWVAVCDCDQGCPPLALDSNLAGYDLLSVKSRKDTARLKVEVKATTASLDYAEIHIFENEWAVASLSPQDYVFHIWQLHPKPLLLTASVDMISSHIPHNQASGRWEVARIPLKSLSAPEQSHLERNNQCQNKKTKHPKSPRP